MSAEAPVAVQLSIRPPASSDVLPSVSLYLEVAERARPADELPPGGEPAADGRYSHAFSGADDAGPLPVPGAGPYASLVAALCSAKARAEDALSAALAPPGAVEPAAKRACPEQQQQQQLLLPG